MDSRFKNGIALSLIPQIILVKWLGAYPEFIEKYYSRGIYPVISQALRTIYGWVPFSAGDLFYMILLGVALRYIILHRHKIIGKPLQFVRNILVVLAVAYFTFHLLWGFNYYRQPLSATLSLDESYSFQDLTGFTQKLIIATNKLQQTITSDSTKKVEIPYSKQEFFAKTLDGYHDLERKFPSLGYYRPSIKTSLFSTLLTYMGYGGYLNPFTNEAQVNALLPNFRFPVVAGHEIGHQIGYSAENETNFVGYLVTLNNRDPYLQYTAMAYALSYCLNDIRNKDEPMFKLLFATVNRGVRKNYEEMDSFWKSYENPMEPLFKIVFNSFLKANNQVAGIHSYNLVVSLLVTYHEQHPL